MRLTPINILAMETRNQTKPTCTAPAAGLFGRIEEKASAAHGSEKVGDGNVRPAFFAPDRARDGEEVGTRVDQ